jgi:hypothetical protein
MSRTRGASHGTHHRKLDMRTEHSVRDRCSRLGTGKYLRRMRGRSNRLARRGTLGQSAPDVVAIMPIRTDCIREQQRPAEKCVFSVRPESVRRRREPLWANGSRVGSSSTSPRPAVRESRGLTPGNPDERAPVCLSHRPGRITQGGPESIYLSAVTGEAAGRGSRSAGRRRCRIPATPASVRSHDVRSIRPNRPTADARRCERLIEWMRD